MKATFKKKEDGTWESVPSELSKREHFAAMAMQGLISSDDYLEIDSAKELAKIAVSHADALLEELGK